MLTNLSHVAAAVLAFAYPVTPPRFFLYAAPSNSFYHSDPQVFHS